MEEIWKDIEGYEGSYQVSNLGRVRRLPYVSEGKTIGRKKTFKRNFNGGVLKGTVCRNGYCRVTLTKDSVNRYYHIHRLVAEVFLPNPQKLPCINHKDENKTNNFVYVNEDGTIDESKSNIEWCTYAYNNQYNGLIERARETRRKTGGYPIKMMDRNGNTIKEFSSIFEASVFTKRSWGTIYRAVKHKRATAAGFYWDKL